MQRDRVDISEIYEASDVEPPDFPKYTTQLMNLANQNSQGTRPRVVGQMSELVEESEARSFEEWKSWYLERHPDAVARAAEKVRGGIEKLREAIEKIDDALVEQWVEDLVLVKTAEGLLIQGAIFNYLSEKVGQSYRPSTSTEEARGIDGYIGYTAVSVKPESYRSKVSTKQEEIDAAMVFYKKTNKYLHIVYETSDFTPDAAPPQISLFE